MSLEPTPRFHAASPELVRVRVRPEREITETDPGLDLPVETRPLPEPPKVTRLRKKAAARRPPKLPPVVEALRRAKEYERLLDGGEVKTRADLARRLGLSRARVTQVMYLLELAPEIRRYVEALEPTTERPFITERRLRALARVPDPDDQRAEFTRVTGAVLQRTDDGAAVG